MTFPTGSHRDVWEAIGTAVPATELDRTGMQIDAEHVVPAGLRLVRVEQAGDVTLIAVEWHPTVGRSLEALDVDVYGYLARLSYSDVVIARRVLPPRVVYVVTTTTADGRLGQMLTVVVTGAAVAALIGDREAAG